MYINVRTCSATIAKLPAGQQGAYCRLASCASPRAQPCNLRHASQAINLHMGQVSLVGIGKLFKSWVVETIRNARVIKPLIRSPLSWVYITSCGEEKRAEKAPSFCRPCYVLYLDS